MRLLAGWSASAVITLVISVLAFLALSVLVGEGVAAIL